MTFEGIHTLLSKYQKFISDRDGNRQKISDIISRVSGANISENEFIVQKGRIKITGNSILKNEIFLYKENILLELHNNGITNITEIH